MPVIGDVTRVQSRSSWACCDRGARRIGGGLGGAVRLHGVVELLLADGAVLGQRRVPIHVLLGLRERGRRPAELALGLVERGLVGPRVDPEQHVARLDDVALRVAARLQVTVHAGADLGVDVAVDRADPLDVDRHVLLDDVGHDHVRRGRRRRRLLAGERRERDQGADRQARQPGAAASDPMSGSHPPAPGRVLPIPLDTTPAIPIGSQFPTPRAQPRRTSTGLLPVRSVGSLCRGAG